MERSLCVVLHDVSPVTWAACQRVIDAVGEVAPVPLTLLVVPRYHGAPEDAGLVDTLTQRLMCGDELALHGYTHLDEGQPGGVIDRLRRQWYTAGEGEFAGLDGESAARRLQAGMQWFQAHGWPLFGFVAPAWLLSRGSWQALLDSPLLYTSTLRKIFLLHPQRALTSQSVVYSTRAGWRRVMSVCWNQALHQAGQDAQPLVRLELHPGDADHAAVRHSWQRLLRWHLGYRRAMTVADFVRDWQAGLGDEIAPQAGAALSPVIAPGAPAGPQAGGLRDLQNSASTLQAIRPPISPPASTSLG